MREMEKLAGRDQEAADACDRKTEGGSPFKVKSPAKGGPQKMGKQLGVVGEKDKIEPSMIPIYKNATTESIILYASFKSFKHFFYKGKKSIYVNRCFIIITAAVSTSDLFNL